MNEESPPPPTDPMPLSGREPQVPPPKSKWIRRTTRLGRTGRAVQDQVGEGQTRELPGYEHQKGTYLPPSTSSPSEASRRLPREGEENEGGEAGKGEGRQGDPRQSVYKNIKKEHEHHTRNRPSRWKSSNDTKVTTINSTAHLTGNPSS